MIFSHETKNKNGKKFVIDGKVKAVANKALNKDILKEFWYGHAFHLSEIEMTETPAMEFVIGNPKKVELGGNAYAVNVDENGIYLTAQDEQKLVWAYMTLIDMIRIFEDDKLGVECNEFAESPLVKNQMVHYCFAPPLELWEHERFIRFCGSLKYTHIIFEFWGTLKFDCMKELSWDFGFTKEEIKPLVKLANDLGMEVVPMFNHWGHASGCSASYGKHTVLSQNPSLQSYFTDDGWCWDISKDKVKKLLGEIRTELIELCGDGEYFHIGCDEAYGFKFTKENMDFICDFINEIDAEMQKHGRKIFVWGDMFLTKRADFENEKNHYILNCPDIEKEKYMLDRLSKNVIIADWQYWVTDIPVKSSVLFKNAGFEVFVCPWDIGYPKTKACFETAANENLSGIIHTTWHTLEDGIPEVDQMAMLCWGTDPTKVFWTTECASKLRKVFFSGGDYRKSGWARKGRWRI